MDSKIIVSKDANDNFQYMALADHVDHGTVLYILYNSGESYDIAQHVPVDAKRLSHKVFDIIHNALEKDRELTFRHEHLYHVMDWSHPDRFPTLDEIQGDNIVFYL